MNIKAKILQIDFEGRSDGESMKKIISNIKPKNLVSILKRVRHNSKYYQHHFLIKLKIKIIVHGNEKATNELAEYCKRSQIVQERIFTPREGEIIDATSESQMYQVNNLTTRKLYQVLLI